MLEDVWLAVSSVVPRFKLEVSPQLSFYYVSNHGSNHDSNHGVVSMLSCNRKFLCSPFVLYLSREKINLFTNVLKCSSYHSIQLFLPVTAEGMVKSELFSTDLRKREGRNCGREKGGIEEERREGR